MMSDGSLPRRVTRGDHLEPGHKLVITMHGTEEPYATFEPGYDPGTGPVIRVYRHFITNRDEKELVLTFGMGGITSITRWLPLVVSAARRMAARFEADQAAKRQQG